MGSSFFGVPNNMGSERCSSRKSKKSDNKPKQPQRGLGVAQLEQIRLRSQMGCALTPPCNGLLQDDMRLQGVQPYGVPQSTSYPYSQSSPSTSTSSPYCHHPNFMMVFGDERANTRYQESHQSTPPRWNPNGYGDHNSPYAKASTASSRHLYGHYEDSVQKMDLLRSMGSSNQYSNSSDHDQEVDLELRLSI